MISVETARSGHTILKKDGKLLASSFDPLKEASAWAQQAIQGLRAHDSIIVLGLGSGYHVQELANLVGFDRLLVIECDGEVAAEAFRLFSELPRERVIIETDVKKMVEMDLVRDVLSGVYKIVRHAPSYSSAAAEFGAVEKLLLGRDQLSFLLQLKARPNLWALLDAEKVSTISKDECISIKTLTRLFGPKSFTQRERHLWRVLEELVL